MRNIFAILAALVLTSAPLAGLALNAAAAPSTCQRACNDTQQRCLKQAGSNKNAVQQCNANAKVCNGQCRK
jgi:hypothetical protein